MKIFYCVLLALVVAGCSNKGVIFKHQSLAYGSSVTTMDARQRAVIANAYERIGEAKGNKFFMRTCAEPFPDIFAVVSSSLTAGLDADATTEAGKLATLQIGGQLAHALRESGAAIERSQTVNLLAMSLYRTCERYLNGAISEAELQVQAMRDQRTMVSILAIEQLTNIARPAKPTIVIDAGETNTSIKKHIPVKDVIDAKNNLDKLVVTLKAKQVAKENAVKGSQKDNECDFVNEADKQDACEKAFKEFEDAESAVKNQQKFFDYLTNSTSDVSANTSGIVSSSKIASTSTSGVKIDSLSEQSVAKIADTILSLAGLGVDVDPYEACLMRAERVFSADSSGYAQALRNCNALLQDEAVDVSHTSNDANKKRNLTFYIQSLKWCDDCANDINKAREYAKAKNWRQYPVLFLSENKMPKQNEIRYFDEDDKEEAQELAKCLGISEAKPVLFGKKAKKGLIELWVVN